MLPETVKPRELLWYHQIQRENRHLLERLDNQRTEIRNLKGGLDAVTLDREDTDKELALLKAEQASILDRRRQDFDREKELLKRVCSLEASVTSLVEQLAEYSAGTVDGTATEQWLGLEQRVIHLERRLLAKQEDVTQVKRLAAELETMLKRVEARDREKQNDVDSVPPVSPRFIFGSSTAGGSKLGATSGERDIRDGHVVGSNEKEKNVKSTHPPTPADVIVTPGTTSATYLTTTSTTADGAKKTAPGPGGGKPRPGASVGKMDARVQHIAMLKERDLKRKVAALSTPAVTSGASTTTSGANPAAVTSANKATSDGGTSTVKRDEGSKAGASKRRVPDKESNPRVPRFPQKRRRRSREQKVHDRTGMPSSARDD